MPVLIWADLKVPVKNKGGLLVSCGWSIWDTDRLIDGRVWKVFQCGGPRSTDFVVDEGVFKRINYGRWPRSLAEAKTLVQKAHPN